MIEYIKINFSLKYFLTYLALATIGVILPAFLQPSVLVPGDDAFWLHFFLMLAFSIALFVTLMSYAYKLRFGIGDKQTIGIGRFVRAFVGGGLLCSLSLLPLAIIFLIFASQCGPKVTRTNVKEVNLIMNAIFYPLFFPAFIYSIGAFSECLLELTATFSIDHAFSIFSGQHLKPVFPFLLGLYGIPASLKLLSLTLDNLPLWFRYFNDYMNAAVLFFGVLIVLFVTKNKASSGTPGAQNGV